MVQCSVQLGWAEVSSVITSSFSFVSQDSISVDLVFWSVEAEAWAQSSLAVVIARLEVVREPPLLGMEAAIVREILHRVLVTVTAFDMGAQGAAMAGLVVVAILKIIVYVTIVIKLHVAVSNVLNCVNL